MADTALQRTNMVESQVRPSDVTDRRITAAMQALARETFVPAKARAYAYSDGAIDLGGRRSLLPPRTLALLLQAADVNANDRVLDIGCGTGYAAAILATMAKAVVALESDPELASEARANLAALKASNVEVATGALEAGLSGKAPYDVILVEGGVDQVPEAILAQLSQNGRLVAIDVAGGPPGCAIVVTKSGSAYAQRTVFNAGAPVLPGFEKPAAFVF